jgi:hypothetical protein
VNEPPAYCGHPWTRWAALWGPPKSSRLALLDSQILCTPAPCPPRPGTPSLRPGVHSQALSGQRIISAYALNLDSSVDRSSNGMKTTRHLVCAVLRVLGFLVGALRTRVHGQKTAWLRCSSFQGWPCGVVAPCQPAFWPHTRARPTEESRLKSKPSNHSSDDGDPDFSNLAPVCGLNPTLTKIR